MPSGEKARSAGSSSLCDSVGHNELAAWVEGLEL